MFYKRILDQLLLLRPLWYVAVAGSMLTKRIFFFSFSWRLGDKINVASSSAIQRLENWTDSGECSVEILDPLCFYGIQYEAKLPLSKTLVLQDSSNLNKYITSNMY